MNAPTSLSPAVELFRQTGAPVERCQWALVKAEGSIERALEFLRQCGDAKAAPEYGTELTRELGTIPGFAEGYEAAQRQQVFGLQLRELREARGLSQTRLAELSGVDQGDISRFEAGKWGKRGISFDMLERILPVLGMKLEHRVMPADEQAADERWQEAAFVMSGML